MFKIIFGMREKERMKEKRIKLIDKERKKQTIKQSNPQRNNDGKK